MRRLLSIAVVALAAGSVIFARGGMQAPEAEQPAEKKLIDLKSDNMGPVAPGDSVIFLVGNFAAQHNGAVITCDSAVRYSDMRIEFFGNVLINKNTTYIYGDRAEYNGEVNEARVFSDIVKVVDEDATLYTYEFLFNTKENVGEFGGGGVLVNRDSRLESVRGYYYANSKELVCVDRVEMRNDEYELKGDSVVYNMATDNAFFFRNTNIWNKEGDYLYADRGAYRKADSLYKVTSNGYVLTDKQEMWSDSIDFYRAEDHIILWRDIQIDDTEHKVLAFGDYGEYWKEPGNAFLTRRPSIVSYDLSQGDSLFMRADSMFRLAGAVGARFAGAVGALFAGACCRRSRRSGRFAGASPFRPQAAGRRCRRFVGNRRFRTRFIGGRRRRGFAACHVVASRRAGPTRSRRFSGRSGACRFAGQCCGYADRRPAQGVAERGGEESQGRGKGGRRQGEKEEAGRDSGPAQGENDGPAAGAEGARGSPAHGAPPEGGIEAQGPSGACDAQRTDDSDRFDGPART